MTALAKVTEGLHSPGPQPGIHNRELDPGFEEDPNIFVVLAGRVFYQTSYDGTKVAITADYPALLPASHVNN